MLTEKQRTRIRGRIYRRYYRLAKKLSKDFREIEIDGKLFKDALALELKREEEFAERGEESMLKHRRFDPDKLEKEWEEQSKSKRKLRSNMDFLANPSDRPKGHEDYCDCKKCSGAFGSEEDLVGIIPESDERREAREEFTREVNIELERACSRGICPRCRSSVCHCEEGE